MQNVSLLLFGVRNTARRSGRSGDCGTARLRQFSVIAVEPTAMILAHAGISLPGQADLPFGETTLPLLHDINTEGECEIGCPGRNWRVTVIPLRMRQR